MAWENSLIRADVVEAQEFPALDQMYNVMAVPKTVINDSVELLGAHPEEMVLAKLLEVAPIQEGKSEGAPQKE
jgi:hypothetical protein